jgi:hypothetical protein
MSLSTIIDKLAGTMNNKDGPYDYQLVTAGSDVVLGGGGGGPNDYLWKLDIQSGTTSVIVKDNTTTIYTWTPQTGETQKILGLRNKNGLFKINATGGSVLATGRFT